MSSWSSHLFCRPWFGHRPRLSVVVVAYNMTRELKRTLYSLSPKFQRDVKAQDYEVIVVDNGSTLPLIRRIDPTEVVSPCGLPARCRLCRA